MPFCPGCGTQVDTNSSFCRSCGSALKPQALSNPMATDAPPERMCPNCGSQLGAQGTFCPTCNSQVPPPEMSHVASPSGAQQGPRPPAIGSVAVASSSPPRKPRHLFAWISGGVVVVGVIIVAIGFLFEPNPEASVEMARLAFQQNDVARFEAYVDVQSVIRDGIDQVSDFFLQKSNIGVWKAAGVKGAAALLKEYTPELARAAEQFVASRALPSRVGDYANRMDPKRCARICVYRHTLLAEFPTCL